MFSTHLPKVQTATSTYWVIGAGVLLIAGLLAGIATVANGEVKKAQMRDALQASQRTAVAHCLESERGAALNICLVQATANSAGDGGTVVTAAADNNRPAAFVRHAAAGKSGQGLIPVSFNARQ